MSHQNQPTQAHQVTTCHHLILLMSLRMSLREVKSFSTDDLPAAQSFFQTYGFVVFKDVLSAAECGCLNEFVHESVAVNRRDVR